MKIVVSLTTIPSRIQFIKPVIESLLNQSQPPDEIHIQIPHFSLKENCKYTIPDFLKNYDKVIIKSHDLDLGSSTKWLYPLKYLKSEPNTVLIIADDDCLYKTNSIKILIDRISKANRTCYCYTGGIIPLKPKTIKNFKVFHKPLRKTLTIIRDNINDVKVDTIQGFSMFAVLPAWFKGFDFSIVETEEIRNQSDDILISGMLEYLAIIKIQLGPYLIPEILDHSKLNPIHGEGRLLKLTLNAIDFLKTNLSVWTDIQCIYPKEDSPIKKVKRKVKYLLKLVGFA